MPAEMTQTGIAENVEINYSHVPRAVKRLQRDGFINELMAHSSDNPTGRRRKAYYLTERGLKSARELMNNLMKYSQLNFGEKLWTGLHKKCLILCF